MRVALVTPWPNAWVPYFQAAIERRGHTFLLLKNTARHMMGLDVVIHGWCGLSDMVVGARNLVYLRRFELFDGLMGKVDWSLVSGLICVNTWIAKMAREVLDRNGITVPVHVIYNGTDLERWTFKARSPGRRIGMACHIHPKKNLPLALQILALLPESYELHIAGEVQDTCTRSYLEVMAKTIGRRVVMYGHVPHEQLDGWWEPMTYCLSTSISEGNPNNVIEAMAKGIHPVVHAWPGAINQFDGFVFDTAECAARMINSIFYDSNVYRTEVADKFSLANIEGAVALALNEPTNEATK